MKVKRPITAATVLFTLFTPLFAQSLLVDPDRIEDRLQVGDNVEYAVNLSNEGEQLLTWRVKREIINEPDHGVQLRQPQPDPVGPRRDDAGDILEQHDVQHFHHAAWGGEFLWGVSSARNRLYAYDPNRREIVADHRIHVNPHDIVIIDDNLWITTINNSINPVRVYNRDGELLDEFPFPLWGNRGMTFDPEKRLLFILEDQVCVFDVDNSNLIAFFELTENLNLNQGEISHAAPCDLTWVPEHHEGHLWVSFRWYVTEGNERRTEWWEFQLSLDENWNLEEVQRFQLAEREYSSVVHDGENLWAGWKVYDDGIVEYPWITYTPVSGVIQPRADDDVFVTLDASDCVQGEYNAILHVISNDPETPDFEIEVILSVEGEPGIELEWELGQDANLMDWNDYHHAIYVNVEYNLPFIIRNTGTAPLVIEDITFNGDVFSVDLLDDSIIPRGEMVAELHFMSDQLDDFEGLMTITSDAPENDEITVDLHARTILPPEIVVNPREISDNLAFGEQTERMFEISNTGDSELAWHIITEIVEDGEIANRNNGLPLGNRPRRDDPGDILATYPLYNDNTSGLTWDGELIWCYAGRDFFTLNPNNNEISFHNRLDFSPRFMTFDGEHIWIGSSGRGNIYQIFDLEGNLVERFELPVWEIYGITSDRQDFVFIHSGYDGNLYVISIDNHEVVRCIENPGAIIEDVFFRIIYVPSHLNGQLWCRGENGLYQLFVDFENDWNLEVVNRYEWDNFGEYGNLTHNGENFLTILGEERQISVIEDGIEEYCWININPLEGEIADDRSEDVEVHLDAAGVFEGNYRAILHIQSNDPIHPEVDIEVDLEVNGIPIVDLRWEFGVDQNTIDFNEFYEEVFAFGEYVVPLRIRNTGSAPLVIEDITSNLEEIEVDRLQLEIAVRKETTVNVLFLPVEPGEYEGVLRISSNDPEQDIATIDLTALVIEGPEITVEPQEINAEIDHGEESISRLTIGNAGARILRWKATKEAIDLDVIPDQNHRALRRTADVIPPEQEPSPAPSRDDPGDILREYPVPYRIVTDMTWDGELIWGVDAYPHHLTAFDPTFGEVIRIVQIDNHPTGVTFDGANIWVGYDHPYYFHVFNRQGRLLEEIDWDWGFSSMSSDQNGHLFLCANSRLRIIDIESMELIATIEYAEMLHAENIYSVEWVGSYDYGQLWLLTSDNQVFQLDVDEEWNVSLFNSFEISDEFEAFSFTHDGINMWCSSFYERRWFVIDDGCDWVHWLEVTPFSGTVDEDEETEIEVTINAERLSGGAYAAELSIRSNAPLAPRVIVPVRVNVIGTAMIETEPIAEPFRNAESLEFPDTYAGYRNSLMVRIQNQGSANLVIERSMFVEGEGFVTDLEDSTTLEPFSTIEATVSFTPDNSGEYTDEWHLFTNAENVNEGDEIGHIWFELIGESVIPPVLTLNPRNIVVVAEDNEDPIRRTLRMGNQGEEGAVNLEFKFNQAEDEDNDLIAGFEEESQISAGQNTPRRDDPGDEIARHQNPYPTDGVAWDGQMMWGISSTSIRLWNYNPDNGEVVVDIRPENRPKAITFDGTFLWIQSTYGGGGAGPLDIYDLDGNFLERIDTYITFDGGITYNGDDYLLMNHPNSGLIYVFSIQNRAFVAQFEYLDAMDNDEIYSIEWVPKHPQGQLWGMSDDRLYQVYVDDEWNVEAVQDFACNSGRDRAGLAHDGENLWVGRSVDDVYTWLVIDDGIEELGPMPWLTVEPMEGSIERGEEFEVLITIDVDELGEGGRYSGSLILETNDPENEVIIIPVNLSAQGLIVHLNPGWNLISINVIPPEVLWEAEEGPDVILMTERLRISDDNHYIRLMKNEVGEFYCPELDFNNIPYWDLTEGYQVKVSEEIDVMWLGDTIAQDADIHLGAGWNFIAYYPTYELDASFPDYYVLSPIIDHVIIAKDINGQFMLPAFDFSSMPPWRVTQGYQVKVDEDVVLNYPEEREGVAAFIEGSISLSQRGHLAIPTTTGENMSILVTSVSGSNVEAGDQITAFSPESYIAGTGMIDTDGRCGLSVWGDDPTTEEKDGLIKGEAFTLKLSNGTPLKVMKVLSGSGLVYSSDEFTVVELQPEYQLPSEFYLSDPFPNPFNDMARLTFGLPEASKVSVSIYDVAGRLVTRLVDHEMIAGYHTVVWDAESVPTGVYLARMEASMFGSVRKLILVR